MAIKNIELDVQERLEIGKKVKDLRKKGFIPAVVYGHGIDSFPVTVAEKAFMTAIGTSAGSNAILNIKVGGKSFSVITHEVQKELLSNRITHIDFLNLRMDEAIKAKVHIELKGIPVGVKDEGGILVLALREIEVKCLPINIPEKIIVDVSELKTGEGLLVNDLKGQYKEFEFVTSGTEQIAHVTAPTKEEVVVPAAAPEAAPGEAVPAAGTEAAPAAGAKAAAAPVAKTEAKK